MNLDSTYTSQLNFLLLNRDAALIRDDLNVVRKCLRRFDIQSRMIRDLIVEITELEDSGKRVSTLEGLMTPSGFDASIIVSSPPIFLCTDVESKRLSRDHKKTPRIFEPNCTYTCLATRTHCLQVAAPVSDIPGVKFERVSTTCRQSKDNEMLAFDVAWNPELNYVMNGDRVAVTLDSSIFIWRKDGDVRVVRD